MEITEDRLYQIIHESIEKYLIEYADPRNRYIDKIANHFEQIVENWCLVHYCTIINEDVNRCKSHWKGELFTQLKGCSNYKLQGNNSYQSRVKAITQAEDSEELLSDYDQIEFSIMDKFEGENINIEDNDFFKQCILDLIKNKDNIIHVIANHNLKEIKEYINNI